MTLLHLLLSIEYDGTAFCGWQKQPLIRTIQSEIEKAARLIFKSSDVTTVAAGRTDKGVHALEQSISLSVTAAGHVYLIHKIPLAFNAVLPMDIAVTAVKRSR
jgi:tRNA pseudouridine38-40 synthase